MNKSLMVDLAVPSGSLEAYVQAASQIPMLGVEEERELAT
ncbi:MAG TPA: RNA polymerase factor sigma-32, partial [Chromatiales bacterium]|nr:RNA polymerase factor sigma-32 [Chromatiales bacterium]HEX22155.1 RNA polymerase factor sigma-32 [Chromatiales bacterium]